MTSRPPHVLLVDDEVSILKTMEICFESLGYTTRAFSRPQDALHALAEESFDLAFVDLMMSPINGLEFLATLRTQSPDTTTVIITAHGSVDTAIEAMKRGAYHYLLKPFDFTELQLFVEKAWEHHRLTHEIRELKRQFRDGDSEGIITRNPALRQQLQLAAQVADSTMSVLIEGESGTGKELVAQYIHRHSPRADKPFVKINCAALPESLLESELFGHVRGAFTGAVKDRVGRFEMADGGSVFLDEIAEMSLGMQVKLLRFLQSREFERVGESRARRSDVRIIAATNKSLDEAMKEKTFREDLFYRLNTIRLHLPPLRERIEDIPLLVEYFCRMYAPEGAVPTVSADAMRAMQLYAWSGNVRELQHAIERAVLLARGGMIEWHHLPEEVQRGAETPPLLSLEEMEKRHIRVVLQSAKDYDQAAQLLGIDPATLWRKRKKYGL